LKEKGKKFEKKVQRRKKSYETGPPLLVSRKGVSERRNCAQTSKKSQSKGGDVEKSRDAEKTRKKSTPSKPKKIRGPKRKGSGRRLTVELNAWNTTMLKVRGKIF